MYISMAPQCKHKMLQKFLESQVRLGQNFGKNLADQIGTLCVTFPLIEDWIMCDSVLKFSKFSTQWWCQHQNFEGAKGRGKNVKGEVKMQKIAIFYHFYAEIVKFGLILTTFEFSEGKLGGGGRKHFVRKRPHATVMPQLSLPKPKYPN